MFSYLAEVLDLREGGKTRKREQGTTHRVAFFPFLCC